ncbi:glutathione S-transferase family protein [Aestuariivirga litoralis]|uniref:glutathione S-transferase family protein n=1 Tax=Aestuariivirga litoralis TaxID=2650924 RepID=UPI0018C47C10|nr:glutathione S-transferase family protein [Aestuariivirga litoralis]MBG1231225.1 glutathione S-transferase family protein [Aestuariivirga litoralis]
MLELYVFGPYFGLPDGSPFCLKALTLMKMSGLPFEPRKMKFGEAPKGKAPYLKDDSKIIADSHFIQRHLEDQHGVDFSGGYKPADLAKGWAVARMLEEHFYFLSMHIRWLRDHNFYKGPYQFFAGAPAPLRPLIGRLVKRSVAKRNQGQGLGRHTDAQRFELGKGDLDAVEAMLSKNRYILGDKVCGIDATVFGFLWAAEAPFFESEIGDYIRSRPVLMNYITNMAERYFPETKVAA